MAPSEHEDLAQAAAALEEELRKFESLSESVGTAPLKTRKHLEKAAKSLQAVADADERLNVRVAVLSQALQRARERKDAQIVSVSEAAQRLQARTQQYQELMIRFGELGEAATKLSQSARERVSSGDAQAMQTLQQELAELASKSDALAKLAAEQEFEDVSREAANLRHELLQTRNALKLHVGGGDTLPS